MTRSPRDGRFRAAATAVAVLLPAPLYFVLVVFHQRGVPAHDVYGYFVPNMLYAVEAFRQRGMGLLWNPFQACGAPFLGNPGSGIFYPVHGLFLLLDPNVAVHAVLVVNMIVGGVGALLLGRQLGLGWIPATGGAIAFEMGDPMVQLSSWSPMHVGPWTWVPWAFLFCERLLRAPTGAGIAGLAVVLALALLPGFPLIAALTAELCVLRAGWDLVVRRRERPWRGVVAVVAGVVFAPLLAGVQVVPGMEFARESHRVAIPSDFLAGHHIGYSEALAALAARRPPVPFLAAPLVLASLAPLVPGRRRLAAFLFLVGALYGVLGLGPATPLYALFARLPPGGAMIREPWRLMWITGFSLTVLAALGLEALSRPPGRWRWLAPTLAGAVAVALEIFTPGGLRWTERGAVAGLVIAATVVAAWPGVARTAALAAVALVALDLATVPLRWPGRLMPSAELLWKHAGTLGLLRARLTPQERVALLPTVGSELYSTLGHKTATVLGVRQLDDFDALQYARVVEYATALWTGLSLSDTIASVTRHEVDRLRHAGGVQHRLLDLAAIRYLVTVPPVDPVEHVAGVQPVNLGPRDLNVALNATALPRARWVPRVEVIADPATLLDRLARGSDSLASVAFVEDTPPAAFTGVPGSAAEGVTRFLTDEPEHITIEVRAPERGFLVLADTYAPGWRATIDGGPVPIRRANYLFRLVDMPAGTSTLDLRYRPASLALGAAVSAAAGVALAVLLLVPLHARRSGKR